MERVSVTTLAMLLVMTVVAWGSSPKAVLGHVPVMVLAIAAAVLETL
eukprot:CAMPEP_0178510328 /NCGR_PEP_ID=MMETSP0696-20121128/21771_1 /TAXON_ID=265572 /ORGANISM="Extubocellulus spinifer, Strain CCMP396" /LENGTH=46 /DNA_ID= /DNA_START= /DNA_END= /DNA_ORIENTATION=